MGSFILWCLKTKSQGEKKSLSLSFFLVSAGSCWNGLRIEQVRETRWQTAWKHLFDFKEASGGNQDRCVLRIPLPGVHDLECWWVQEAELPAAGELSPGPLPQVLSHLGTGMVGWGRWAARGGAAMGNWKSWAFEKVVLTEIQIFYVELFTF